MCRRDGADANDGRIELEEVERLSGVDADDSLDLRSREHRIELIHVNGAEEGWRPFGDTERDLDFVATALLDDRIYRSLTKAA